MFADVGGKEKGSISGRARGQGFLRQGEDSRSSHLSRLDQSLGWKTSGFVFAWFICSFFHYKVAMVGLQHLCLGESLGFQTLNNE